MSRTLVLDTETTGFDPLTGDRVLEVAAVELLNLVPTGRHFHVLIDPEREVPEEAAKVHGFTWDMLRGKPKFAEIAAAMLEFLGDDPVVAHNANFDFAFLDFELKKAGYPVIDRSRMVDSLAIAKKRFPGLPNSLDALCRRYGIDNSMRTSHNALLDVELLAQVYLELMGGKQPGLALATAPVLASPVVVAVDAVPVARIPRPILPTEAELEAHRGFLAKLKEPIWAAFDSPAPEAAARG
ncbi:DNA polymerase III subunit epsilon [Teichococcus vastitatis]|uniref:DNA polymerase III subunit epsilon n=1 Tax=Teichococcus vastitatis TaxID=2307076 RepID=A0ABS9W0L6_9PROT|nr:DNA polymerase III subunit epsilon [Pseudoroseomonas vastitatis]MCI0752834.1 DNA polymerase III subunit epsilon [Pseudoroseomonas vastitatis]